MLRGTWDDDDDRFATWKEGKISRGDKYKKAIHCPAVVSA